MIRTFGSLVAALVLSLAIPATGYAQANPPLITGWPTPPLAASQIPGAAPSGIVRQRDVTPNFSVLKKARAALQKAPSVPYKIDVAAFDDAQFTVSLSRVELAPHGVVNFYGTVDGQPLSSATFVLS
ncbi:MAG TPA: hypothetical protein VLT89_00690, partial [Usitatibacter sp.]|nr:hypothetical protein [Usitatibacter sp.]